MEEIELFPAYYWRCPKCRRKNFVSPVPVELTDEDKAEIAEELREELSLDPWEDLPEDFDDWITTPAIVTCRKCLEKFKTLDDDDE